MEHPEFKVHTLNAEGIEKAILLRDVFNSTLDALLNLCPTPCREMSIVKTKLEEAYFFSKKALASQKENQR